MISRKVCILGAFSVGKTSLVRRFVHEVFDDRYVTTLGVKIETKELELPAGPIKMIIWDMEGTDVESEAESLVTPRMKAYLQGVNGVLLVADGTRAATVETALRLHQYLASGQGAPATALLLNKCDLEEQWEAPADSELEAQGLSCYRTSALTGEQVEIAFRRLAEQMSGTE